VPTFTYGHDDFFLLENGWRALQGQRPHLDYWSPWGPLTNLVVALGLKLGNDSPNGIGYGNAIFAFAIGLWTYRAGRHRLAPAPGALLAVYAALLVCSPYALGSWPMLSTHAMTYNRFGYALLVPLMLECFQRVRTPERNAEEWIGGISTGAASALTLFLKASYFLVALGLIAGSFVLWRPNLRRVLGMLAGFAAVGFLGSAYLRFDLPAMFHALQMAAAARAQSLSPKSPIYAIEGHLNPLLIVLALAAAASFLKPRRPEWLGDFHLPLLATLVYLGDIALLSANAQSSALPLLPVFAVLTAGRLADLRIASVVGALPLELPYHASLLLLCGLVFVPQFSSDVTGLAAGALRKAHPPESACSARFTEPRLAALILCDRPNEPQKSANGALYTTYVNEGVSLLRQHCDPTDKVLTMDMQNPFPYALGWPPPSGGIASISFNYTLSAQYRPSFDAYFGDATIVMVPRRPAQTPLYIDEFYRIYFPALAERFQLAAESDWWRLYKRR